MLTSALVYFICTCNKNQVLVLVMYLYLYLRVFVLVTSLSLDVLALCETWTRVCVPDAANMDFVPAGYDCINVSRTDGRRGGGLVVL